MRFQAQEGFFSSAKFPPAGAKLPTSMVMFFLELELFLIIRAKGGCGCTSCSSRSLPPSRPSFPQTIGFFGSALHSFSSEGLPKVACFVFSEREQFGPFTFPASHTPPPLSVLKSRKVTSPLSTLHFGTEPQGWTASCVFSVPKAKVHEHFSSFARRLAFPLVLPLAKKKGTIPP